MKQSLFILLMLFVGGVSIDAQRLKKQLGLDRLCLKTRKGALGSGQYGVLTRSNSDFPTFEAKLSGRAPVVMRSTHENDRTDFALDDLINVGLRRLVRKLLR